MPNNVLLVGASGLIGQHLLNMLQSDPRISRIYAPSRQPLQHAGEKVINPVGSDIQIILDTLTEPVDTAFCCVGTTQKEAKSRETFRFVDITLPVHTGKTALRLGATHYLAVSAIGANAKSWIFYNKTKGQMEQAVIAQNWPHLTLVRPSILIGKREIPRTAELLGASLFQLLSGKWKSIPARDVAYVLWQQAFISDSPKITILESDQIREKAASL